MSSERKPELPNAGNHRLLPLLRVVFTPLLFLFGPVKVRNRNAFPRQDGVILIANHLSDSDPMFVQYACPRGVHFMSKSELFSIPVLKQWLRFWGSFPVKRGAPDRQSLRLAAEIAKQGRVLGIFPEGQLSESGKLIEIREGVALIIRMARVPVIVCGLKNTNRVIPYGSLVPRPSFQTITATFGDPRTFEEDATNAEIVHWIEAELRRLIPEPHP